jgi:hypothetical protein
MRQLNKKLAIAATATALLGAIGASVAQTDANAQTDPMATPQQVEVNGSGQQIYFFRDQGNSPETDPAAHLLLIKHQEVVPVAQTTTTTTTVAQATTTNDNVTTTMPAAADTSNTQTSTTDTTAAAPVVDNGPTLAPKADRN